MANPRPVRLGSTVTATLLAFAVTLIAGPSRVGAQCVPATTAVSMAGATVLGNGSPGSVTTAQIQTALDAGGKIRFDLGPAPVTIATTAELVVSRETVIDGGDRVTLDAGGGHRILRIDNPMNLEYTLTLQNLTLRNGATPSGSGAAVHKPSGGPWQAVSLHVVGVRFEDNVAIQTAQDDGGGAIYATGLDAVRVADSTFAGNRGSNGGALYSLGSKSVIVTGTDFTANVATGTGGNPGNGGNGGAIGIDGADRLVDLCDVRLTGNRANAFGAGFFTVMYDTTSLTRFEKTAFENNDQQVDSGGFAGGAYLQGGPFAIVESSFIGNQGRANGALFIGPNASGSIVNSTIADNLARASLGGGMSIDDSATVSIVNSTIAGNRAPCDVCFAAGISNGAGNQITLTNTILADNVGGNVFNPWNIRFAVTDGGGNMQFPQQRPNGQTEPAATPTVIWDDPDLGAPAMNGGPTRTQALPSDSPARDAGTLSGAPTTDQRGIPRDALVDIGAYEWSGPIFADGFESGDLGAWSASSP